MKQFLARLKTTLKYAQTKIRSRKKTSVAIIIVVMFFGLFMIASRKHQAYIYRKVYGIIVQYQERSLGHVISLSPLYLDHNAWKLMQKKLGDHVSLSDIDFYVIRANGKEVAYQFRKGLKQKTIPLKYHLIDQTVKTAELTYMTTALDQDHTLTVGIVKDVDGYVAEQMGNFWYVLAQEMVYVFIILGGVVLYSLRDVLKVIRRLRKGEVVNLSEVRTNSAESDLLVRGLSGYARAIEDLTLQNETLGKQVLPALKKEILSGKPPPYDFRCTMVRTDINNFSHIYNAHDVTKFMSEINRFFTEVSHVVSRYNGQIHEFVGDEVIFYFKDDDHSNSFVTALSAIRDINEIASQVHERTKIEHGYAFTVKSSLAHGVIRFGPLVNGFTLAGSVLIETVRILSHVTEKEENATYFEGANLSRVKDHCFVDEAAKVFLKGYAGEKTLFAYRSHQSLEDLLSSLSMLSVTRLAYYRSDKDISSILNHLRKNSSVIPLSVLLTSIQVLRGFRVTKSESLLKTVLMNWISELTSRAESSEDETVLKTLSAVTMLVMNLVPVAQYEKSVEDSLSRLVKLKNRRVVANALDVMTHFKAEGDPQFLSELVDHSDNRVAANALVHEGIWRLGQPVLKRMKRMLKSKQPAKMASALYALGELAAYHRSRDVVFYSTQVEFLNFVQQLPSFLWHSDPMVRRQALIAARKAGDAAIVDEIWDLVRRSSELRPELRNEVELHLGPPSVRSASQAAA